MGISTLHPRRCRQFIAGPDQSFCGIGALLKGTIVITSVSLVWYCLMNLSIFFFFVVYARCCFDFKCWFCCLRICTHAQKWYGQSGHCRCQWSNFLAKFVRFPRACHFTFYSSRMGGWIGANISYYFAKSVRETLWWTWHLSKRSKCLDRYKMTALAQGDWLKRAST